jgi:hypothetical protein
VRVAAVADEEVGVDMDAIRPRVVGHCVADDSTGHLEPGNAHIRVIQTEVRAVLELDIVAATVLVRLDITGGGKPIGSNDLLIAAHALSLGHTLITDNTGEFGRVNGLKVENWLRP